MGKTYKDTKDFKKQKEDETKHLVDTNNKGFGKFKKQRRKQRRSKQKDYYTKYNELLDEKNSDGYDWW
jgi:hypothetical protein